MLDDDFKLDVIQRLTKNETDVSYLRGAAVAIISMARKAFWTVIATCTAVLLMALKFFVF